jgi:hypothetical protein
MIYKCITVSPEYAADFISGEKDNEYRSWYTNHRGALLICASARKIPGCISGHAVMLADLVDVTGTKGDYVWVLRNHRLIRPFAVKGKQRLFEIDADIEIFGDNTPQEIIDQAYLSLIV